MSGRRVRCAVSSLVAGSRELPHDASRYLLRVHRLRTGDTFTAFDPEAGVEALGRIMNDGSKVATVRFEEPSASTLKLQREIILLQALGKGDKSDFVIREVTQLGATRIVFVDSERSEKRTAFISENRRRRWRTIAVESARQCGRGDIPTILGPLGLGKAISEVSHVPFKRCLALGQSRGLAADLAQTDPALGVALLVGPEGGLSDEEIALAEEEGFEVSGLGTLTLRTETAAVVAVALASQRFQKSANSDGLGYPPGDDSSR